MTSVMPTKHQAAICTRSGLYQAKGGFSHRLKKESGYLGEVWQKVFSEVRVNTDEERVRFRKYIQMNPVKAGLVNAPESYPYCFAYLANKKLLRG
jgi:putative transposase